MPFKHIVTGFDPEKIYMLGEESSGLEPRGPLQNYEQLKQECLQKGILFEDPQFVPAEIELGALAKDILKSDIKWLRPKEIRENGEFIIDGLEKFDINQGSLGDCWFLASLVDITQNCKILEKVVPKDQSFEKDYAGIFHFRFWQYGRWIDVVIDDRLPSIPKNGKWKLIFAISEDHNEFWTALLEKAYAKLYGSYANLKDGTCSESLQDLTGGFIEIVRHSSEDWNENLFEIMKESYEHNSFQSCAIMFREATDSNLRVQHTYSVTGVAEVQSNKCTKVQLLRIRNPWGKTEWTGRWSDRSDDWKIISKNIRDDLLVKQEDGEFWMDFPDFIGRFDFLEICHPYADMKIHTWNIVMTDGGWNKPGSKANPQYKLTLKEKGKNSTVKVSLMQKNRRIHHQTQSFIGFKIKTLQGEEKYNFRPQGYEQVTCGISLPNGEYLVIPIAPKLNGEYCGYLLRIYCTGDMDLSVAE
ncbi:hypothetical protein JTB14_020207 [Gonioctena quinquepunctata]|nr:hypothetical protein JTB14_020207 [Gonioctena quinquepunctata]